MAALNLSVEGFVWEAEPEGGEWGEKRKRERVLFCVTLSDKPRFSVTDRGFLEQIGTFF